MTPTGHFKAVRCIESTVTTRIHADSEVAPGHHRPVRAIGDLEARGVTIATKRHRSNRSRHYVLVGLQNASQLMQFARRTNII
jgi:hypothetical protein